MKRFRDGLSYSTPQNSEETRGSAITQPQPCPIIKNVEFRDGIELRLGNGTSPCFFLFFLGVEHDRPSLNPFCFSEKIFCFLFVEMRSQLEITEMLECKVNLIV